MKSEDKKRRYHGSVMGGLIMITIGAIFLIQKLYPQFGFGTLWPLLLIVIGAVMIWQHINR